MPARRLVVVAGAGGVDARLEGPPLLGVEAQDLGEPRPRVGVVARSADRCGSAPAARSASRARARSRRRTRAGSTRAPCRSVADDAAGRREDDAADDVLVRDVRSTSAPSSAWSWKRRADETTKARNAAERHPLVALAELADVRARERAGSLTASPRSLRALVRAPGRRVHAPARCGRRAARRRPSRSRAAARAGRATRGTQASRPKIARSTRTMMLWTSVNAPTSSDLHQRRLRGEPDAGGAGEDERRHVRERVEPDRRDPEDVGRVAEHERDRRAARERVLVHAHEEDERQDERRDGRPMRECPSATRSCTRGAPSPGAAVGRNAAIAPGRPGRRGCRACARVEASAATHATPRARRHAVERAKQVRLKHEEPSRARGTRRSHLTACRADRRRLVAAVLRRTRRPGRDEHEDAVEAREVHRGRGVDVLIAAELALDDLRDARDRDAARETTCPCRS